MKQLSLEPQSPDHFDLDLLDYNNKEIYRIYIVCLFSGACPKEKAKMRKGEQKRNEAEK